MILGALIPLEVPSGSKREQQKFKESGAKLLWAIDKVVKNFLLVVWKKRSAIAGTFTIEGREIKAILPDATEAPAMVTDLPTEEDARSHAQHTRQEVAALLDSLAPAFQEDHDSLLRKEEYEELLSCLARPQRGPVL